MQDFRNLLVWQKAYGLTLSIYKASAAFPDDERFTLTMQIRRSAASIGANIAEGCGRGNPGEFSRFLRIALGSAMETYHHLLLARDLGYLSTGTFTPLESEILSLRKMLWALATKSKASNLKLTT